MQITVFISTAPHLGHVSTIIFQRLQSYAPLCQIWQSTMVRYHPASIAGWMNRSLYSSLNCSISSGVSELMPHHPISPFACHAPSGVTTAYVENRVFALIYASSEGYSRLKYSGVKNLLAKQVSNGSRFSRRRYSMASKSMSATRQQSYSSFLYLPPPKIDGVPRKPEPLADTSSPGQRPPS